MRADGSTVPLGQVMGQRRRSTRGARRSAVGRARSASEQLPQLVVDTRTTCVVAANAAACALYGSSPEQLTQRTFLSLIAASQRADRQHALVSVARGRWRHQTATGQPIAVSLTARPTHWQGRRALAIIVRPLAHGASAAPTGNRLPPPLAALLRSMSDGVIAVNAAGDVLLVNDAALQLYGFDDVAQVQRHGARSIGKLLELREPDGSIVRARQFPVPRILRGESLSEYEVQVRRLDTGAMWWATYSGGPLRDATGEIAAALLIVRDITARKRAESTLRLSEERLRVALANSPITVYSQDRQLRYTWMYNPATGYAPTDSLGRTDADLLPPDEAARLTTLKQSVLASGVGVREQVVATTALGHRLVFDLTIEPVRDTTGAITGITGAAVDITERTRVEAERERLLAREQQARRDAEAADRVKDEFLVAASHELRTPLTVIKGYTQAWARRISRQPEVGDARVLDALNSACDRLTRLVQNLIDVSRMPSEPVALRMEPLRLDTLVREACAAPQLSPARSRIALLDSQPVVVSADRAQLTRVLLNLLVNAVTFSPGGGEIEVSVSRRDVYAVVSVRDVGIGIPEAAQTHIFERFYRAHSGSDRDRQGLGMGLYVSREVVRAHGGDMWFTSEEGVGSTFRFSLPLAESSEDDAEAAPTDA